MVCPPDPPPKLALRDLGREDFGVVSRWLAEPLVAYWWHHDPTPEGVERLFGGCVDGTEPTTVCVAFAGNVPFGLVQGYRYASYPEYEAEVSRITPVPPEALSVDYLVGSPGFRRRGLGAAMISAFIARSWAEWPAARDVIVPVSAGNESSWRLLERVGFVRVAAGELEPDNPREGRDHFVYRLTRPGSDSS